MGHEDKNLMGFDGGEHLHGHQPAAMVVLDYV